MVVTERRDKLLISREELLQARIYTGMEGVRLGLVGGIGGDTDAIEKAASLAGVSNYGLVDVNTEVFRIFFQKLDRILGNSAGDRDQADPGDIRALMGLPTGSGGTAGSEDKSSGDVTRVRTLRSMFLASGIGESQEDLLPGFPLKVNPPNLYYLYVGPSE